MQDLLRSLGLGGLVPGRLNVPAAPAVNTRNGARNNAQHPPGNEPEEVEEDIAVTVAPAAVEGVSPPGSSPTVGGRRKSRKGSRKSRKSRKASKSRKGNRKSRKASRKSRKSRRN